MMTVCLRQFANAEKAVQEIVECLSDKAPTFILFLVHRKNAQNVYLPIKRKFNAGGIPTQFWVSYHEKNSYSILSKILTQILAKNGRCVWKVESPIEGPAFGNNTQIIGVSKTSV